MHLVLWLIQALVLSTPEYLDGLLNAPLPKLHEEGGRVGFVVNALIGSSDTPSIETAVTTCLARKGTSKNLALRLAQCER